MSDTLSANIDWWLFRISFSFGAAGGIAFSTMLYRPFTVFPQYIGEHPTTHYLPAVPGAMILALSCGFAFTTSLVALAIKTNACNYLVSCKAPRNAKLLCTFYMGLSIAFTICFMASLDSPSDWPFWPVVFAWSLGAYWGLGDSHPMRIVYQRLILLSPRPIWIASYCLLLTGNTIGIVLTGGSELTALQYVSFVNITIISVLLGVGLIFLSERARKNFP
ncbi:hypothetical protein [Bremerella cremea]|uniref:hypothetical protein n=1 Tax=Bremerella cremea TaxID=1031537 RepID=UPI0011C054CC|nr:hypothetical protein [Bremerella cremea]